MFAYVDETGNTGGKMLDDDQPLFMTAAFMTRSDFELRFGGEVRAIAKALGEDQIHAAKLGVGKLEDIASDILRVVRKAGPAFALARVEKRYVGSRPSMRCNLGCGHRAAWSGGLGCNL